MPCERIFVVSHPNKPIATREQLTIFVALLYVHSIYLFFINWMTLGYSMPNLAKDTLKKEIEDKEHLKLLRTLNNNICSFLEILFLSLLATTPFFQEIMFNELMLFC
jgi:magnesium-transporting ATPase (P-type)